MCFQMHVFAYNLGNFLRTLPTPETIKDLSLTTLKEKLIKSGAKVVSLAGVAISRHLFARGPDAPRRKGITTHRE